MAKCWVDLSYGTKHPNGYWCVGKSKRLAHRVTYQVFKGVIPKRLVLHHKCENKLCYNPNHLEPMSRAEHNQEHMIGKPSNNPKFKTINDTAWDNRPRSEWNRSGDRREYYRYKYLAKKWIKGWMQNEGKQYDYPTQAK